MSSTRVLLRPGELIALDGVHHQIIAVEQTGIVLRTFGQMPATRTMTHAEVADTYFSGQDRFKIIPNTAPPDVDEGTRRNLERGPGSFSPKQEAEALRREEFVSACRAAVVAGEAKRTAAGYAELATAIALKRRAIGADELGVQGPVRPLVGVQSMSPCVSRVLAQTVFAALTNESMAENVRESAAWERVRVQLAGQCVSFLMIDELHHAFVKRSRTEIRSLVETLKNLCLPPIGNNVNTTTHPVGLILAGLPVVGDIVNIDTQLATRKKMVSIHPLTLTESDLMKFRRFIEIVEPQLNFPECSHLSERNMILRLHKASKGYTGRAMRLIKKAANIAIYAGDPRIDRANHLGRAFEEELALGPSRNPFLIADLSNCPPVPESAWSEPTLLRSKKTKRDGGGHG